MTQKTLKDILATLAATKEEVELDELSRKTLGRYISKASDARGHRKLSTKKQDNRYKGVSQADKKLAKKEEAKDPFAGQSAGTDPVGVSITMKDPKGKEHKADFLGTHGAVRAAQAHIKSFERKGHALISKKLIFLTGKKGKDSYRYEHTEAFKNGTVAILKELTAAQRARRDAVRAFGPKDKVDPADRDDYTSNKDDQKLAKLNPIMQIRKAADVKGNLPIKFADGKTKKLSATIIQKILTMHDALGKPQDKLKFALMVGKSYADAVKIGSMNVKFNPKKRFI